MIFFTILIKTKNYYTYVCIRKIKYIVQVPLTSSTHKDVWLNQNAQVPGAQLLSDENTLVKDYYTLVPHTSGDIFSTQRKYFTEKFLCGIQ